MPLTHPALRAGSTLSRTAGEGAERSEAGEGLCGDRFMRVVSRDSGLREKECAAAAAGCPQHLSADLSK
jgi:hypothetical protein